MILPLFPNLFAALDIIHDVDNKQITDNSFYSVQPAVAMENEDYIHVIFRGSKTIYYKKINKIGGEVIGNSEIAGDYTYPWYPRLATDSWGNLHVVWHAKSTNNNYEYIYYVKLNKYGGIITGPKTISQQGSRNPDIDIDNSGYIHVVWWYNGDIYYEMMDNNGYRLWDNVKVSRSGQGNFPSVAGSGPKEASIVWEDQRDGKYEIYYSRFYDGYEAYGEKRLTYTYYALAARCPTIKSDPFDNDNFLVVWRDMVGSGFDLVYRKIDYYGTTIIDDKRLFYCTERVSSYFPPFTVDQNGDLHVVGVSQVDPPSIYYGRFDNDGNNILSEPELISVESTSNRYALSVTATPSGEKAFIFWSLEYSGQIYMEGLSFTQYGSVSGHVYDGGGTPLNEAKVIAIDPDTLEKVGEGMSGPDGSYVIPNLPQGTYHINAEKLGYESDTRSSVVVTGGQDTPNIDFSLVYIIDPGSVSGTVYKEGGDPLEGAEIKVYEAGTYNLCKSATCDHLGKYHVLGLSTGLYDIAAYKYGYTKETQENVLVIGRQNTSDIDFTLFINPGSLSGRITETDEITPIVGVEVEIKETGEVTYTDSSGEYSFSGLLFGDYTLYVKKDGYKSKEKTTSVRPGENTSVDFILKRKVPPPENLGTRLDESNNLIISWDAVTKDIYGQPITVDYYSVYRSKASGGPYALLGTTPTTSFTDSDLIVGVRYFYVVTTHCVEWNLDSLYSKQISRIIGGTNLPPEAIIQADITNGHAPLTVQFDASGSYDPEGDNLKYYWDFDAKDGIDLKNPDSRKEKQTHVFEETGYYIVTLTVFDSKGSGSTKKVQIIVYASPPENWDLFISTSKDSYIPGEDVEITIEGWLPFPARIHVSQYVLDKNGFVEYLEYRKGFDMDQIPFVHHITIPALPVYNNLEHIIRVRVYDKDDHKKEIFPLKEKGYKVEWGDPDMIILTNPRALNLDFPKWEESILFLLKNAITDNAIFVYTDESNPEFIRSKIIGITNEICSIKYIFILGGNHVVPYFESCNSDGESCSRGISDYLYWDLNDDYYPDLNYSRLPTASDLDYFSLNEEIIENILNFKTKSILEGLILAGRDTKNLRSVDKWFTDMREDILNNLSFMNFSEFRIGLHKTIVLNPFPQPSTILISPEIEEIYTIEDLLAADFIGMIGHGNSDSVNAIADDSGDFVIGNPESIKFLITQNEQYLTLDNIREGVAFIVELLDSIVQRLIAPIVESEINENEEICSDHLDKPLVLASACQTSNIYGPQGPLSYSFLGMGALSYGGYGDSICGKIAYYLNGNYTEWLDGIGEDICLIYNRLGNIFYFCIEDGVDDIKGDFMQMWHDNLKDTRFFIQYGYPKLQIITPNSNSLSPIQKSFSLNTNFVREIAPSTMTFSIDDYLIDQEDSKYCISFTGTYNGEPVESEDWILQGNPIVPCLHKIYDIPSGKTVDSISFTTIQQSFGTYELAETPGTYFGDLYEYYPLNFEVYMSDPVQWRVFEKFNGEMVLVIDLFPFEYHVDTHEVIMHSNFNITVFLTDRISNIDEVYMDKSLYIQGETVYLVVGSTGASEVKVMIDNENEMIQDSEGYNVFSIETSDLMPGSHTISIQSFVGDTLMDEVTTGFSLTDALVEIEDLIVPEIVRKGDTLSIFVPLINRDISPTTIDLQLNLLQENYFKSIDLGSISLDGNELKFHIVGINTNSLQFGELVLRIEGNSEFRTFRSNYAETYVVEGVTEGEGGTKEPVKINALALSRIRETESLQEEVYRLLEEAKEKELDTSTCELIIEEALSLLEEAKNFYAGGNYIAANYYALEAIEKFKEAIKCLEDLLGK